MTLILALLTYVVSLYSLWTMHGSDAAGNALAQAFAVLVSIGLWILLAVLLVITAVNGGAPAWWNTAALVLFPVCAISNFVAIALLRDNLYQARWPLAVPALMPLLLLFVALRPMTVPAALWAVLAALSVLPWPALVYRTLYGRRDRERAAAEYKAAEPQRLEQERLGRVASFEKLDDSSPLQDWLEFTSSDDELRDRALAAIRMSPRRQADAEQMMREGRTHVLLDLPDFDVQATPPICEGTRRAMRELVDFMQPSLNSSGPIYLSRNERIQLYRRGIAWAIEHGCECATELAAIEEAIRHFQDTPERRDILAFLAGLRR